MSPTPYASAPKAPSQTALVSNVSTSNLHLLEVPDYLFVVHEDYEWRYLLTCKDIHKEAEHILPGMLHLRILVSHFDVQHMPPAVRARYLAHIRILTIVGSYPVYDTIFDGSQLTSLKTVYLRNEGSSSRINQQFGSGFPPPSPLIARIQGSDDREYIEKGLRKLQVSKLIWWQAEKVRWLHSILDADRPRNFQLIISQDVRIMFIEPVPNPQTRSISPGEILLKRALQYCLADRTRSFSSTQPMGRWFTGRS